MTNSIEIYIKSGLGIEPNPKNFRKFAWGSLLLVSYWGVPPGIILGKPWSFISILMIVSSLLAVIIVHITSKQEMTIRNRLLMQGLIYLNWVFQLSLVQILFFTMAYGFNIILIVICLPQIITPLVLGFWHANRLKKGTNTVKTTLSTKLGLGFGWTGCLGLCFARLYTENISQHASIIFIILALSFLASIFSFGLLSFQRLYYYLKLSNSINF